MDVRKEHKNLLFFALKWIWFERKKNIIISVALSACKHSIVIEIIAIVDFVGVIITVIVVINTAMRACFVLIESNEEHNKRWNKSKQVIVNETQAENVINNARIHATTTSTSINEEQHQHLQRIVSLTNSKTSTRNRWMEWISCCSNKIKNKNDNFGRAQYAQRWIKQLNWI